MSKRIIITSCQVILMGCGFHSPSAVSHRHDLRFVYLPRLLAQQGYQDLA